MNGVRMLLQVENLQKHFDLKKKIVRAVDGISFSIGIGETFGLVGESGCGKTTVAGRSLGSQRPHQARWSSREKRFSNSHQGSSIKSGAICR
jgi:ABC-type dipeptide/oligopeptide/nickel transport system ATPase subunit